MFSGSARDMFKNKVRNLEDGLLFLAVLVTVSETVSRGGKLSLRLHQSRDKPVNVEKDLGFR